MNDTISRKGVLQFLEDMKVVVPNHDIISETAMTVIECVRRFVTGMPSVDDLSLGTDNSAPHVELEPIAGEYNRYHGELDVRNGRLTIYGSDRCVCCGAIVPEGTQICPTCIRKAES